MIDLFDFENPLSIAACGFYSDRIQDAGGESEFAQWLSGTIYRRNRPLNHSKAERIVTMFESHQYNQMHSALLQAETPTGVMELYDPITGNVCSIVPETYHGLGGWRLSPISSSTGILPHESHPTREEAILDAVSNGYVEQSQGCVDGMFDTPAMQRSIYLTLWSSQNKHFDDMILNSACEEVGALFTERKQFLMSLGKEPQASQ